MSILIKGMEMPTSCGDCKAFVCYKQWAGDMGDCFCGITKEDAKAKEKNADCPLVPVHTPHGRLIDADAEIARVQNLYNKAVEKDPEMGCVSVYEGEIAVLKLAPTIIPASEEGET